MLSNPHQMSLNSIELSTRMLTDFYGNCLVVTSSEAIKENINKELPKKSNQLKYLGKNGKNILIIVDKDHVPFLPDGELSFLTNILSACKLSMADISIINRHQTKPDELTGFIESSAKIILLFGTDPLAIGLPINFPPFQLQAFNSRTYLYGPSLSELETDKELKMKLWSCLKALFGI